MIDRFYIYAQLSNGHTRIHCETLIIDDGGDRDYFKRIIIHEASIDAEYLTRLDPSENHQMKHIFEFRHVCCLIS